MREIVVGTDVAYAAKQGGGAIADINEVDLLAAGAIAVFNEDGDLIASGAGAGSQAGKAFQFAFGRPTNKPAGGVVTMVTEMIPNDFNLKQVVKTSYDAPAYLIRRIGYDGVSAGSLNLPATLVVGDTAEVKVFITEETASTDPSGRRKSVYLPASKAIRAEHYVTNSSTQDSLVADLVAKLNANEENDYFTASVAGTYAGGDLAIVLTGTKYNQFFYVASGELLADADNNIAQNIDFGHGTAAQVLEEVKLADIENGDTSRIHFADKYWQSSNNVSSSGTYASWKYAFEKIGGAPIGLDGKTSQLVTVFVPDGTTIETNLTTIAAALSLTVVDGDTW